MNHKLPAGQHFGAISKSCNVAGFTLTKTAYTPHLKLPKHSHERACFCLVLRGNYVESYGKRKEGALIKTLMKEYGLSKASVYRYLSEKAIPTLRGD